MTQTKLTEQHIGNLKQAQNGIFNGFVYSDTDEGFGYWQQVVDKLDDKIKHGTSDGKPWVDPEPPIPEGWRKADADEWKRNDVKYWDVYYKDWRTRLSQGTAFDPPVMQTRYIVPIDPPLTDQDACVWPRLLVMVRNEEGKPWHGPYRYLGKTDDEELPYVTNGGSDDYIWSQARRATPAEIEAAK